MPHDIVLRAFAAAVATATVGVSCVTYASVGSSVAASRALAEEAPAASVAGFSRDVDEWKDKVDGKLSGLESASDESASRASALDSAVTNAAGALEAQRDAKAKAEERRREDEASVPRASGAASPGTTGTGPAEAAAVAPEAASAPAGVATRWSDAGDAPASAAWVAGDSGYREAMVRRAEAAGSATDWLVTVDCDAARVCVLSRDSSSWRLVRGWDCAVGRVGSSGRSSSVGWGVDTIQAKYPDAGAGAANPWMMSISGDRGGFGIHGTQGSVDDRNRDRGTTHNTSGGIVIEEAPARWMYDTLPLGTRVVTFDSQGT